MSSFYTTVRDFFLSLLFMIYRRREKSILFIPHENCDKDGYDIFCHTADNVLMVLNTILFDERFSEYSLYIVYYDKSKLELYDELSRKLNRKGSIVWFHRTDYQSYLKALLKCRFCFTAHPHYNFKFKSTNQVFISLGYFTPFKDDYYEIKRLNTSQKNKRSRMINKSFDYHIVTSLLAGRIISLDTLLDYSKFLDLGFPRNDVFYNDNKDVRCLIKNHLKIGDVDTIICYTPTYRDYERQDLEQYDKSISVPKTIMGYLSHKDEEEIVTLLDKFNAIIIAKNHSWQELSVNKKLGCKRIVPFERLKELKLSLYDIMAISDCLITDYTSTSFDYMHADKPIIYYFYDYQKYVRTRGFSYKPVQSLCGGPIVFSGSELISTLYSFLNGGEMQADKRRFVHNVINCDHDGLSTQRFIDFILKK